MGDPLVLEPDGFVNLGQAFSANPTESGTFSQFSGGQVTTTDVVFVVNQVPSASIDTRPTVVLLHDIVTLDGSGWDPDGHPILLEWTLTPPLGSSAQLVDPSSPTASFTPDLPGNYVVTLLVSDPFGPSEPATLTITALGPEDYAREMLLQAMFLLEELPVAVFDSPGHRKALLAYIRTAIRKLDNVSKHLNKVLMRCDGYALGNDIDEDDWITDRTAQEELHSLVRAALDALY
ncbi:MAG: PKD domain-containing protein [Deltaproteobacteria bacterium]|nr:PKD domain-containing protein [Deltaproteobacteria bacterium]